MKSKKLIILISIIAVVVAVIVIMASVFSVQKVATVYHKFDGGQTIAADDAPSSKDVLDFSKGRSIFFLSKDKLLTQLNQKFTKWHAFAVVKNFPNIIEVHFVERVAAVKVDVGGNMVYVDSFGYVVEEPSNKDCIDISSVFERRDAESISLGSPLKFLEEINNARLHQVLQAIIASWQCNLEVEDLPVILGKEDVFRYENGDLIINTLSGAKIRVISPENDLTKRIIAAYSVYYTDKTNLQQKGVVITVRQDGSITTNTGK